MVTSPDLLATTVHDVVGLSHRDKMLIYMQLVSPRFTDLFFAKPPTNHSVPGLYYFRHSPQLSPD